MMAKKKKKSKGIMKRTNIPYAQRLQIQQISAIKAVRDYSAKVTMFCHSIALHELHGIGYKRLVRFSLAFKGLIDEFYDNIEVSLDRCRRRLSSHGIEIPEEIPVVTVPELNHRDQQQYDHAIQASYIAHLVGLIAVNETFGFGKEKLESMSVRAAELTDRYNKEGDKFLFEEMQRIGFPVIDGHVVAFVDDDNNPITHKKWMEANNETDILV